MIKRHPHIVVPQNASLPPVESITLPNGLPVHLIRTAEQDVVRVTLVWEAGSAVQSLTGAKPFTASATLNLLAEGSERYTAHEIAEKLDFVGSYYDLNIDRDYAMATFCCLGKFFEPTLEMMREIVLRPAFPPDEVAFYARKRMERLAVERSKPATKARELFSAALFGDDHPYGISSPESDYLNLTRADIEDFYRRFYGAEGCFVVCTIGDDPARREALLALLSELPHGARNANNSRFDANNIQLPTPHSDPYRFLPVEGALQSAVRIGRLLFPRSHPDFVGMQVVATILGGYFGSRLTQNLREKRGYTYGVMAAMVNLRGAGYLAIATEVAAEAAADTVRQIFIEMERLKTELVGPDELDTVRRSMLGEVMRILDGPFGVVDVVIESIQVGGDNPKDEKSDAEGPFSVDYLNDFVRRVEATTPEHIMELARKYLIKEEFTTVIVGKE